MTADGQMDFQILLDDFDLELLPSDARTLGSAAFETAVREYFEREFAPLGGTVAVRVNSDRITVTWRSPEAPVSLFDRGMSAIRQGHAAKGVTYLEALTAVEPKHAVAHYNVGMVLSDLGNLEQAQLHLLKAAHLDPDNANALVALGLALYRDGNTDAARRRLEQALALDPDNGHAHRNLGAMLGSLGDGVGAIDHLRQAHRLLPDGQTVTYGLAQALEDFGGQEAQKESGELYAAVIDKDSESELAELARQARSNVAAKTMKTVGAGPRMDAVMYCLGALEKFAEMPPDAVHEVAVEIALKGRSGLEVNNPDVLYTLRTLPGEFTGMHLMCLMYTAFQQIDPSVDIGFDVSQEYKAALELFGMRGIGNQRAGSGG